MIFVIALSIVGFIGLLAEMLTYKVGQGGGATRIYRAYKATNVDLVIGFVLSVLMLLKGSTPVVVIGVIIYLAVTVIAVIRVNKRIIQEIEQSEKE